MDKGVKEIKELLKKMGDEMNDVLYKQGYVTAYQFSELLYKYGFGPEPFPITRLLTDVAFCPEDRFDQMEMVYLGKEA